MAELVRPSMERSALTIPSLFQPSSVDRSAIALPPRFAAANRNGKLQFSQRSLSRSTLPLPPCHKAEDRSTISQPKEQANLEELDFVALVHYISSNLPWNEGSDFKVTCAGLSNYWNIVGQGRTFVVRRFPTGSAGQLRYYDHWRPSMALKTLRVSATDRPGESSLRYKSLIQELRILRHPPLTKHPNFLRLKELSWELDNLAPGMFLPTLLTEYAVHGSLHSFLSTWDLAYFFKRRLILDVAEALWALHQCSVTHGDVKVDNVLLFPHDDETFPFIAKLADFGFSMDTCHGSDYQYMVGGTQLWAAPEASEQLRRTQMHFTDVYSFGFLAWCITIDGQSPFEALQDLPQSLDERIEGFQDLKESDKLIGTALKQTSNHFGFSSGIEQVEVSQILHCTLQLDPYKRSLAPILDLLREECYRVNEREAIGALEFSQLTPFDSSKVEIKDTLLRISWLAPQVMRQFQGELEKLALKPPRAVRHSKVQLEGLRWRYPRKYCTREAGAAFTLCTMYASGYGAEKSLDTAGMWLMLAGYHGYPVAQAMCAVLAKSWQISIPEELRTEWILEASRNGAKPSLQQLQLTDQTTYQACEREFRQTFWARCYNIPEEIISALRGEPHNVLRHERTARGNTGCGSFGTTMFHAAAMIGSLDVVQEMIEVHKIDINLLNERNETALHLACRSGHANLAGYLLSLGASAKPTNSSNENGLHWLSSFNDEEIFELAWKLIEAGADIHGEAMKDEAFFDDASSTFFHRHTAGTPLHRAVECCNMTAIQTLLDLGAHPMTESARFTPLCRAVGMRCPEILRLLLQYAEEIDINRLYPDRKGQRNMALINRALSKCSKPLLHYLSRPYHDKQIVETLLILISRGARTFGLPNEPIISAMTWHEPGALDVILSNSNRLCLEKQKDPGRSNTPLLDAICLGDKVCFEILVRHGANALVEIRYDQSSVMSALHMTIKSWHQDTYIAERLVQLGVDVNHNKDVTASDAPLCYALQHSMLHHADHLICHGARLDQEGPEANRNVLGELLWCVPDTYTLRSLRFLLNHPMVKLPFIVHRTYRYTVFHAINHREIRCKGAIQEDWLSTFKLLRQVFPEVHRLNEVDATGCTPLHMAVFLADPFAVKTLIEAGADPRTKIARPFSRFRGLLKSLIDREEDILAGSIATKSPAAMAKEGLFHPIPDFVLVNPDDSAEWLERRQEIVRTLAPFA